MRASEETSTSELRATSRAAIVGGALDAEDPAVVAILPRRTFCEQTTPSPFCTGTLISPRVVLTAAHCLAWTGGMEVYFGASTVDGTGRFVVVTATSAHPKYDPETHAFDVAVLRLAEDPGVAPLPMGTLDGAVTGASARVAGFGIENIGSSVPGTKRQGVTKVTVIDTASFRAAPGPAMTCAGDSGGPVFFAGADAGPEALVGVTAAGDRVCETYALNVRVDAVRDFIDPFVVASSTAPAGMPSGSIKPSALCSQHCAARADCPAALECSSSAGDGTCLLPGLAPMGAGDECSKTAPCAGSAQCARFWPSGAGACRCVTPCEGVGPPPIPSTSASASPLTAGGGGCAASRTMSASPAGSALGAALAIVLLGRRRKPRR